MALLELWLLACAPAPAPARVEGRTVTVAGTGLSLRWPEGWIIAVDPKHFRSGMPDLVLEGRRGGTLVALSFHPMPPGLGLDAPLDALMARTASPDSEKGAGYALSRLPWCGGAIEQITPGEDGRALARYAWAVDGGLAVLSAWSPDGDPDRALVRALVCGRPA